MFSTGASPSRGRLTLSTLAWICVFSDRSGTRPSESVLKWSELAEGVCSVASPVAVAEASADVFLFLGLYGPPEDLALTAAQYGVFYAAREGTPESGYLVDHTATLLAIDTEGFLRVLWTPEVTNEDLTADLKELLN